LLIIEKIFFLFYLDFSIFLTTISIRNKKLDKNQK
jgi:hypothetical protein